jgi:pSer/pThr/pTyr-binding forkhead associated (FHA) protein
VEFYDEDSTKWQLLARVEDDGLNLGRSSFRNLISKACEMTIAESHARIDVENEEIRVTPLKSRNGLYKKLPKGLKHELSDGDRFRLWRVVLEFRSCAAAHGQGLVLNASESDEIPINKVPEPIGFLHVIGKDDKPQITFPLMKTEIHQVSLGRKDGIVFHYPEISRSHARIEFKNDRVYLVDCGSRNGTFVRIDHPTKLKSAQLSDSRSMESLVEEVILGDIRIRVIWTTIKD